MPLIKEGCVQVRLRRRQRGEQGMKAGTAGQNRLRTRIPARFANFTISSWETRVPPHSHVQGQCEHPHCIVPPPMMHGGIAPIPQEHFSRRLRVRKVHDTAFRCRCGVAASRPATPSLYILPPIIRGGFEPDSTRAISAPLPI